MKNELNQDWDNLLNGKSTSQQLEIFMNIINEAKNKYVPRTNSKAKSNAKKHKFIPLDDKTIKKSRRNIDVGKDTWRPRIANCFFFDVEEGVLSPEFHLLFVD
jgi:hypothetical protein